MKRIMIIGGNGAGKTTFSRELSEKLKLPLVHLDSLYWKDNWNNVTSEEFDNLLHVELEKSNWILDGNMSRTIPKRLKYSDTVIYFDFPRTVCTYGILKRYITNRGMSRPDMGGYCPERISWEFLKSVWHFNSTNRKIFYEMINNEADVNVVILKNRKQVTCFLENLIENISCESWNTKAAE